MRKKKVKKIKLSTILMTVILAAAIVAIYYLYRPVLQSLPQLSTFGYSEALIRTDRSGIVKLNSGCLEISMFVAEDQVVSIENGMAGFINYRPNAHDLMKDLLDNMGIEVLMAKVERIVNSTYHANLVVKKDNLVLSLDSKPSDAIAIAIRENAPIYVKEDLFEVKK